MPILRQNNIWCSSLGGGKEFFEVPAETGEDIAKTGGYSVSPKMGMHSTFRILPMSSFLGQYTWPLHDNQHNKLRASTLLEVRRSNTSPVASGIAEKFEGVLSPTNH